MRRRDFLEGAVGAALGLVGLRRGGSEGAVLPAVTGEVGQQLRYGAVWSYDAGFPLTSSRGGTWEFEPTDDGWCVVFVAPDGTRAPGLRIYRESGNLPGTRR